MSEIRNLTRNGETFFPLTHVDAVVDSGGNNIGNLAFNCDVGHYWGQGQVREYEKYALTSYIDVSDLGGVWWNSEIPQDSTRWPALITFDENYEPIPGWYWTTGNLRWIDFERNTESGAKVKYLRATVSVERIMYCYIEDSRGNVLWSPRFNNPKYNFTKEFNIIFQQNPKYSYDGTTCTVTLTWSQNYSFGYFSRAKEEKYLRGSADHNVDHTLTYVVPNFNYLIARDDGGGAFYVLKVVDVYQLLETDILILYTAYGKAYGPLADYIDKRDNSEVTQYIKNNLTSVDKSIYNVSSYVDLNKIIKNGVIYEKLDFLVTPYIDVTELDGVWIQCGTSDYNQDLCCFDENYEFITDWWWSTGLARYIDFERSTESGARVKYVRCSMYVPNISDCCIKTSQSGDTLWEPFFKTIYDSINILDNDTYVPKYYESYIKTIESKIFEKQLALGSRNDSFFFITDVHTNANALNSGKLLRELMKKSNISRTIFGGDIIRAFGGRQEIIEDATTFVKNWYEYIKPYGDFYSVQGNHDLTIATSWSDMVNGYTFSFQSIRNFFMSRQSTFPELHYDNNNPDSIWFYLDNESQKIRYIFVSTTDASVSGNVGFKVLVSFRKQQSDWCYQAINSAPSGYGVIVIGHIPAVETNAVAVQSLSDFLSGFKNKRSVTVNSTTYDFTNVDSNLLFMLAGHEHRDDFVCYNNVPYLISACDTINADYKQGQFGEESDFPDRTRGTIYEQLFDAVFVDLENETAQFIRIGGGYDRICHFDIKRVSVNSTLQLTTTVQNPEWLDCDGTGNYYGGFVDGKYIYENRHTMISLNNGLVTPKGPLGNAVVCARNRTNKIMEIFFIEVY